MTPVPQTDRTLAGIALMLAAMFAFSLNDVMGKWLVATYGVAQLLLIRSGAALLMLAPAIHRVGLATILRPRRPWLHALRAFCSTAEVAFFYWAVTYLPLADTVAFYLASPIFVTILAALFLKERVGWRRWLGVSVGFAGVLIALQPGGAEIGWPALIALSGALIFAASNILTRELAGENEVTLVSWQVLSALLFGLTVAPFRWVAPGWLDFAALMLLGIVSALAHMGVNRSLKYAPASVVVPYQYTLIVWATLFGIVFFGDWPGMNVVLGSLIIVAAGLWIFMREQARARERAKAPAQRPMELP
ncbi:MAG: DMT family transporter [Hyphomicrobiales bacterium]|nr:DMT family transporter [Hyphomicrobiales bacterium]